MAFGAGALRDRIRFERRGAASTVGGKRQGGWAALFGPIAADAKQLTGGETMLQGRLASKQAWTITVRGSRLTRSLTTTDRAVDAHDATRTFNIRDISNPDQRGRWYVLLCELDGVDG